MRCWTLLTHQNSSRRIPMHGYLSIRFYRRLHTHRPNVRLSQLFMAPNLLTNYRFGLASTRQCHHDPMEGTAKGAMSRYEILLFCVIIWLSFKAFETLSSASSYNAPAPKNLWRHNEHSLTNSTSCLCRSWSKNGLTTGPPSSTK